MALRAVIDHPKFSRLKMLLRINKSCTLGYLEGLWHFCGRYTPAGNIGKYSDAEIEAWLEWDGEEGALITAYKKAGWIDVHPDHRLSVHDWHQHADDATRKAVHRAKLTFVGICPDTVQTNTPNMQEMPDGVPTVSPETPPLSGLPEPVPGAGAEPVILVDLDEAEMRPESLALIPTSPPVIGTQLDREEHAAMKALVVKTFDYYRKRLNRDPKRYTLTETRLQKALVRVRERLKVHDGDLGLVEFDLLTAVDNLAASEYHQSGGYVDWIDQIFRSEEEFEKRLNWKKGANTNAKQRNFADIADTSRDALDLLAGMDTPAYLGGGIAKAGTVVGQIHKGVDGPALAANPQYHR